MVGVFFIMVYSVCGVQYSFYTLIDYTFSLLALPTNALVFLLLASIGFVYIIVPVLVEVGL